MSKDIVRIIVFLDRVIIQWNVSFTILPSIRVKRVQYFIRCCITYMPHHEHMVKRVTFLGARPGY